MAVYDQVFQPLRPGFAMFKKLLMLFFKLFVYKIFPKFLNHFSFFSV